MTCTVDYLNVDSAGVDDASNAFYLALVGKAQWGKFSSWVNIKSDS